MTSTLLPEEIRINHSKNNKLGCGNFLHIACEASPYADQRHIWLDKPFTLFTGETYEGFSLLELRHAVDTLASWYYGSGVRAKDPIAVYISEGIENIIHYLALNAIGAIPAIVNGNVPKEIAALWMKKVGVVGLYSDAVHQTNIAPYIRDYPALRFFVTNEEAAKTFQPKLPKIYPYQHSENDTVLVGHSSGTTGLPKAVQFQHQQFFYGIRYRLGLPFAKGSEKVLSALPHSHSAGIAYITLAVLNGSSTMVLSSNKPETILPAIDSFKPSMVVAFPETYVHLSESNLDDYDLSSIQLWFNGGDAAHEAHIRKLISKGHHVIENKICEGSIFIDGLGSSEMGFSLFRNVHTLSTEHYDRCIGKPLDWVDATVLGDNGEKLPPYRIGKLGVKSPSITPGYWNDSVLTARSQINGYFLTGDLFYHDEQGRFFHVDRISDAIQTSNGPIYSLQTEEFLLKKFPEIADCSIVSTPNDKGEDSALIVVRLKEKGLLQASEFLANINIELIKDGKTILSELLFGELDDFPTGPTGKILKRELRDQFKQIHKPEQINA